LQMLKRIFILTLAGLWLFSTTAEARFIPKWYSRISGGYSYWKLEDLNQRILNRRPFFNTAGALNHSFNQLPSGHPSFNLGLQYDLFSKISLLATFEYRRATVTNGTVTDSFRVEAITRPIEINLGLDVLWRLGPKENILVGVGSGLSYVRFRDDIKVFDRRADPDSLSELFLEKYNSLAIFGEVRAIYVLPFELFTGQHFFLETLGRLNPIDYFAGTTNRNGNTFYDVEAIFLPAGSIEPRLVKLDFSGFYIGFGSNFRL